MIKDEMAEEDESTKHVACENESDGGNLEEDLLEESMYRETTSQQVNTVKPKRRYRTFSEESLQEAVRLIKTKKITQEKASKEFNISKATLQVYLKRCKENTKTVEFAKLGGRNKLAKIDEDRLVSCIKLMDDNNQPVTYYILKTVAETLLEKNNRSDKKSLSREWCRRFLKKHNLSEKIVRLTKCTCIEKKRRPTFSEQQLLAESMIEMIKEQKAEEDESTKHTASTSSFSCPKLPNIVTPHCLQDSEEKEITQNNGEGQSDGNNLEEELKESVYGDSMSGNVSTVKQKRPHRKFSEEKLQEAVRLIKTTKLTTGKASKVFNISKATLQIYLRRCKGNTNTVEIANLGRPSKLSKINEDRLISYIKCMDDNNQPVTYEKIKTVGESLLNQGNSGDRKTLSEMSCRRLVKKHKLRGKISKQSQISKQTRGKCIEEKRSIFSEEQLPAEESMIKEEKAEEDESTVHTASTSSFTVPNIVTPHWMQESEENEITQNNEHSMIIAIKEEKAEEDESPKHAASTSSFTVPNVVTPHWMQESEENEITQNNEDTMIKMIKKEKEEEDESTKHTACDSESDNLQKELEEAINTKTMSRHGRNIVKLNYSKLHEDIKGPATRKRKKKN